MKPAESGSTDLEVTFELRRQQTLAAIREKRTLLSFWANDEISNVMMDRRAVAAAQFIPPGSRVLDVGCGEMLIEKLMPEGCHYQPLDCVRRDERTVVCDLNRDPFPAVSADIAMVLGVIEYLHNVPSFLRGLRKAAPKAIISYHPLERHPERDRLKMHWVNALNTVDLVALLRYAGYRTVRVERYAPKLFFFVAEGRIAGAAPQATITDGSS